MGYDRGDSFPFDFEPNGLPFGSKSKGKLFIYGWTLQVWTLYLWPDMLDLWMDYLSLSLTSVKSSGFRL